MTSWAPGQLSIFVKGRCCWLTLHDGLRDNIVKNKRENQNKQTQFLGTQQLLQWSWYQCVL